MSLKIGDRIDGKYEIKRLLGEGGMGAVYEGENTLIHRRVAIKVLHSGVAALEEAVKRFENEAQAAGRIGSDHIVEVLDLGRLDGGDRYMVMEFLKGESLSARIAARKRLSASEITNIGLQLLEGLSAAHEAGIIHRDLKPDNVFLLAQAKGRVDFVKILDFGISKFNVLGNDFSMTRTGAVMGTPYYMAPEQARGAKHFDARLDVYAAGVILYEAATGKVPFDGDTFNELLIKIATEESPSVRVAAPDLDPRLADIIDRARRRNPEQRFASAREFHDALAHWSERPIGSDLATGATLPVPPPPVVSPGADTALAGGAGLASREMSPARATADFSVAAVNATAPFPAPAEPAALGNRTGQAWSNTHAALPSDAPRKRSVRRVMIGGGIAALLSVLVLVVKLQNDAASSAARAAAMSASVAQQVQEAREEAAQKLAEEQARTRELEAKQEARRQEQERAEAAAAQQRAAEEEQRRAESLKVDVTKSAAVKVEATKTKTKAKAETRARASATRSSATPAVGGRRIRTSL
jgi:serine/threonine-protein kinase